MTFTITTQQLSLVVGKGGKREVRPGSLQLQVGGSSALVPGTLTQPIALTGSPLAPKYHFVAPVVTAGQDKIGCPQPEMTFYEQIQKANYEKP